MYRSRKSEGTLTIPMESDNPRSAKRIFNGGIPYLNIYASGLGGFFCCGVGGGAEVKR